jgi:hypothetical protein
MFVLISMDFIETRWEGMDWIHVAQDRDQWWAVLYTLIYLWFP